MCQSRFASRGRAFFVEPVSVCLRTIVGHGPKRTKRELLVQPASRRGGWGNAYCWQLFWLQMLSTSPTQMLSQAVSQQ
jgi:hypothetical protein